MVVRVKESLDGDGAVAVAEPHRSKLSTQRASHTTQRADSLKKSAKIVSRKRPASSLSRAAGVEQSPYLTAQEVETIENVEQVPKPSASESRLGRHKLKVTLVGGDALAYALGFGVVIQVVGYPAQRGQWRALVVVAVATAIGLLAMKAQGLFLARVSVVRVLELTRSTRAAALTAGGMIIVDRVLRTGVRIRYLVLGAILSWFFIVVSRSIFRSWLALRRSDGQHQRRVVFVGTDDEASRLVELFDTHADLGMAVVGVVGSYDEAVTTGLATRWIGEVNLTEALVARLDASGVVVSPNAVSATRLNTLIRNIQNVDGHVHLATGVSGIDARRLRSLPLSYEPLLYVEASSLSRLQVIVKRTFDVVVSALLLILAAPLLVVIAVLIWANDRGPVTFRQRRVGLGGATFDVLKFRTMVVDAEAKLATLQAANQRNGPLFKMDRDPRVTKIGRFLRETSLDELPQLVNVLRGEMSLVGPRPALPSEVANFDLDLRQRERVLPGITGLWQVEARDNPSFMAYRRLDLFYVENWSITLDLMIILRTFEQLLLKAVQLVVRRIRPTSPAVADEVFVASGSVAN
ncbi:MAG TPA: sugar transferase [Ilumatobacteraceae bacterium]|nr:sugar transferase [Ilumatobacteraceae bacterium]